jgi:Family of unknown function (DUF5872)
MLKRTNQTLWERVKSQAKAKLGGHSARAMQMAVRMYKSRGGSYSGPKATTSNNSLKKWQSEKWKTSDGKPAMRKSSTGKSITTRFLPAKAWSSLSPSQVKATNAKKISGKSQFVENTKAAKAAGKGARG